jgi:hypothetical protein
LKKAIKRPAQARERQKIRATTQDQYKGLHLEGAACTNAPSAQYFVAHSTWSKVFLPTLLHLFFISGQPFQDFTNNTPTFVAIVQEAFNATHPNISFAVIARDTIVTTVRST